jgi:predicted oxidoreductase
MPPPPSDDPATPAGTPARAGLLPPTVAGVWRLAEWGFDLAARVRWIESVLALGIDTFDHADLYGDYRVEGLFGEALAAAPGLRDRLRLVTKCGIRLLSSRRPEHTIKSYDSSAAHIEASVESSLRALRTDRIDLLLLHRPDLLAEPDEIAAAFERLRLAGKVLHFGASNHAAATFARLHARIPLATHQFELSPLRMQALADGTLEQAAALGLPPMIWSPLAGGRLWTGGDDQSRRVRATLEALAHERGVSANEVAYAWVRRHPSRPVPITGSRRLEALREAVASHSLVLGREDWYRVWQASMGHEVP